MGIAKYIPDFLKPTDDPQPPVRIYDVPLRRELYHKSEQGNEYTASASRNNSVVSQMDQNERRRSSTTSWHPGMAFEGLGSVFSKGSRRYRDSTPIQPSP